MEDKPDAAANAAATASNDAGGELNAEPKSYSVEDLLKRVVSLESTNKRLLDESKNNKQKYLDLKGKEEIRSKQEAEVQGKYKELYESTEEKLKALSTKLLREKVYNAVSSHAAKAGCVDVEAALRLGTTDLLQYDDEKDVVHGADVFVEDLRKNKPWLFQAAKSGVMPNPLAPGGQVQASKQLTAAEIARLPQAQRDKVMGDLLGRLK